MKALAAAAFVLAASAGVAAAAPITDEASAIEAAKRYTKARCTDTPCRYKARREGGRWNVWVDYTRRAAPGAKPQTYHGGHVILYFDREGHLVRRIEGQ